MRELTKSEKKRMKEIFDGLYIDKNENWKRKGDKMIRDGSKNGIKNDSWKTDKWILDMFPNHYDPCPYNSKWDIDGLESDWSTEWLIFINPPYSNPLPWVEKAIAHKKEHNNTIVMLLKHDSSTKWYRLLHEAGANFLMIAGRLKYQSSKSATFPSVMVVL